MTAVLAALDRGDTSAAERLLPLVYDELRALASARMAGERAGQTIQPTALVHEAYLRLVGEDGGQDKWQSRAHFFSAAAVAMRRILVERARARARLKRGGDALREQLETDGGLDSRQDPDSLDLVGLDAALDKLAGFDRRLADMVMLRFFAGLSVEETAKAMATSERTVKRDWEFARTWLLKEMQAAG
ncbi:MAG: ECF-type sigma factor [Phycisphaerales bacterium]